MPRPFDSATARSAGKASGTARRAARRLTLPQVEEALGPLQTEQHAKHRLERLGVWLAAGLLSGSQGGAAVRATEVWLRAHSDALDRERLRAAEKRVRQLERELAKVRGRGLGIA